ncbi:aldehyde dehydrogenase family protein, partial [Streptomyces sp. GSL17-113]
AGRLGPGTSGRTHAVVDPATGQELHTYELAGAADVDTAVSAAAEALPGWAGATPAERSEAMHRWAARLTELTDEFVHAESLQCGKPL